jgi:rfaE bifunctional protein kinase chain/domain
MSKVVRLSELEKTGWGESIVGATVCFGHFNIIHPGHVRHFRTAVTYGSPLVVAVEGDSQLPEIHRDSVFPEEERAQALGAIDLVDFVVILDSGNLKDFVDRARISTLVLGREFESTRAETVAPAIESFRNQGGTVVFDPGETHYASSELLYGSPGDLEKHRWQAFTRVLKTQNISLDKVFKVMEASQRPHILVVGDVILDRYVACDPIGMSNEAPVIVVKELETQDYVGGAGIIAAHVAALGSKSTIFSVVGRDDQGEFIEQSLRDLGVETILVRDEGRPTTLKTRFLVENQKLFRVSRLKEHSLSQENEDALIGEIERYAKGADGILVSDFVYGVITKRLLNALRSLSVEYGIPLFGDLQCSSQIGNILKFEQFFLICPTEKEARIALGNHDDGVEYIANLLIQRAQSENTVVKLGSEGFISYLSRQDKDAFLHRQHFPALTANPADVTGAGDALLAAMATGLTRGLSMMEVSALACLVSAIAVQTVGNRPISLNQVQQYYRQHKLVNEAE